MGPIGWKVLIWNLWVLSFVCFSSGFTPVDNYLIDCGSSTNTTVGSRVFLPDNSGSKFLSTPKGVPASTTVSVSSSEDSPLYQTARIFDQLSKYSFPIGQAGRHWIRLYFYPFVSGGYDMKKASFGVSTQSRVLLNSFSVSRDLVKEFSVNVTSDTLDLTFIPSTNSFAFINAIEVVSVPDEL
ncbi:hypothetical protein Tsubulata_039948, partial [Turnera subulata]